MPAESLVVWISELPAQPKKVPEEYREEARSEARDPVWIQKLAWEECARRGANPQPSASETDTLSN